MVTRAGFRHHDAEPQVPVVSPLHVYPGKGRGETAERRLVFVSLLFTSPSPSPSLSLIFNDTSPRAHAIPRRVGTSAGNRVHVRAAVRHLVGWPGSRPLTAHLTRVTSLADLAALRHHPMQGRC